MKRLFMTFAAMLLMSVSAFAQSSDTPLNGDVNGDGKVDVSDITAIITIMKDFFGSSNQKYYWYVGTEPITSTTIPGDGVVAAFNASTELGWHKIDDPVTEIHVGEMPRQSQNIIWYIAIPYILGITKATSGGLTDGSVTSTTMTLSDGVLYRVFTTSPAKKIDYLMTR